MKNIRSNFDIFLRTPLFNECTNFNTRKVDLYCRNLKFPGPKKNVCEFEQITSFFLLYLDCLQKRNILRLKESLEPRFYEDLSNFLIRNPVTPLPFKNQMIKTNSEHIGSRKIFGPSIIRKQNRPLNEYEIGVNFDHIFYDTKVVKEVAKDTVKNVDFDNSFKKEINEIKTNENEKSEQTSKLEQLKEKVINDEKKRMGEDHLLQEEYKVMFAETFVYVKKGVSIREMNLPEDETLFVHSIKIEKIIDKS